MVDQVDVRINNVDTVELTNLSSLLEAMKQPEFHKNVVQGQSGDHVFVVRVQPGRLQTLKDALRAILKIVKPERVVIET